MGLFSGIFRESFSEGIDGLRKSLIQLELSKATALSASRELRRIQVEWTPCKEEISKGNSSAVLNVLDEKYEKAVKSLEETLKKSADEQTALRKGISDMVSKNPSYLKLLFSQDFMTEENYNSFACAFAKAHQEGKVGDTPLKKFLTYKKEDLGKDKVAYVKSDRVEYADVIILDDEDKVLFTIRNKEDKFCPGGYCLPGGHIEKGETPKVAAMRELLEETGIQLSEDELALCGEYLDEKSHIHYFVAHKNVEPVVLQEKEQIQWEKLSQAQFSDKPLICNLENNLNRLLFNKSVEDAEETLYFNGNRIKKGNDKISSLYGLNGHCAIFKADSNELFVYDMDVLEKASNLVRKKVFVTRNGKTFLTTVYVNPQGDIDKKKSAGQKETEIESSVNLEGIALDDEIEVRTPSGVVGGKITSIRWTARDGGFMLIESSTTGQKYTVLTKNIRRVLSRKTSTVKLGAGAQPQPQPQPQAPKPTQGIDDWMKELSGGVNYRSFRSIGGSGDNYLAEFGGKKWVLKKERMGKDGHLASESRADFVYRALGFDAPDSRMVPVLDKNSGSTTMCKTNEYMEYKELGSLRGKERENAMKEVAKGFALDALLGNWDVLGGSGDNILVKPDGSVYRMDNGASFEYRARGSKKNSTDFLTSTSVVELDTMRSGFQASSATLEAYGKLSDEDVCKQIDALAKRRSELADALRNCGASGDVMRATLRRLDYMVDWAKNKRNMPQPGKWDKVTDPNMPSGVTEEYFKDWDAFDFKVDSKYCSKDVLKKNIIAMEKKRESGYKQTAQELGMTVGEYKHKLQVLMEAVVAKLEPFSCTDTGAFQEICKPGGRYKSCFETHTKGASYESGRAKEEYQRYGFANDRHKDASHRMICGYLTNNRYGGFAGGYGRADHGIPPTASGYGSIMVRMKRESAVHRATFTCENSLGYADSAVAVPFGKPHFAALKGTHIGGARAREVMTELENFAKGKTTKLNYAVGSYFEVQFHDGLGHDDISCVNLCRDMMSRTEINDAINVMIQNGLAKVDVFSVSDI